MSDIHRGIFIVLSVDDVEVGYSDSCTLDVQAELLEKTPDSGGYRSYVSNLKGGTISTSGLVPIDRVEADNSYLNLFFNLQAGTVVALKMQLSESITTRFECNAIVDSFSLNGDATGYATYSASFTITGLFNFNLSPL